MPFIVPQQGLNYQLTQDKGVVLEVVGEFGPVHAFQVANDLSPLTNRVPGLATGCWVGGIQVDRSVNPLVVVATQEQQTTSGGDGDQG